MERTWICRTYQLGSPRNAIHLARTTRCFYKWHQEAEKSNSEKCHKCFLEPASESAGWNGNSIEPQGRRIADGWQSPVSHFLPESSSDRTIVAWTIPGRMEKLHSFDNKKLLAMTILTINLQCFYNQKSQWYEIENQVVTQRNSGRRKPNRS